MGNRLLQVLMATITSRIMPIITKLRLWTSWNYISTQLFSRIRAFISSHLNIKPRHKKDYYEVFGWLVSKRLAIAALMVIGVLSLVYLFGVNNTLKTAKTEGVKTYNYNSLLLRFVSGRVRIKGKSGYLAYEGDVDKGSVTGNGTLYNPAGAVVYQGEFAANKYQGSGTSYYADGTMEYQGNFTENLFDGSGKLYRANGSLEYDGEFAQGKKDGKGILYDSSSTQIYDGRFSKDELVYSDLIGKSVSEVATCYTGGRTLYEGEEDFAVLLEDIDAIYVGQDNSQSLDDEMTVDQVLVLKDSFPTGSKVLESVDDLKEYFGPMVYEGNSDVTMAEAVAINRMALSGDVADIVEMDSTLEYDDYCVVDDWDDSRVVYLYSFRKDGLIYTFVCGDRYGDFSFYYIEKEEGGAA